MECVKYSQNWQAYDRAQCREKTIFMPLLAELCRDVEQKEYFFGRPMIPMSDMLFCTILKIYSMRSLRRFMGDLKIAKEAGFIDKIPSFASIGHFLQRDDITQPLMQLISKASMPLKSVESDFAIDASGFTTCRYTRWFDHKYGKETEKREWIKAHIMCGVKTNIVTSVIITDPKHGDSPYLKYMLEETAENFNINEISADKAYSSRENMNIIDKAGATPFIPFRANATGTSRGSYTWRKMYHYFMYNQKEFMEHYHKRSNVETTFHMIKTKFGDSLKSKSKTAQINEILCKILCHNLCVLIHELHEIRGDFHATI